MSTGSLSLTRRGFLAGTVASGAITVLAGGVQAAVGDNSIRPFVVNIPQEDIDDLRQRIAHTRWPDMETVGDASQGPQLANVRELVDYWGNGYDWRGAEAKLNALP